MSSKPSPSGVAALRAHIHRMRQFGAEVDELDAEISVLEDKKKRRREAAEKYAEASRMVIKSLDEMDCASAGNFGWENRMVWMLDQLDKQASEAGK